MNTPEPRFIIRRAGLQRGAAGNFADRFDQPKAGMNDCYISKPDNLPGKMT